MLVEVIDFVEFESQEEQKAAAVLEAPKIATALSIVTQNGEVGVVAAALVVALVDVAVLLVAFVVVEMLAVALVDVVVLVVAFWLARGPAAASARDM